MSTADNLASFLFLHYNFIRKNKTYRKKRGILVSRFSQTLLVRDDGQTLTFVGITPANSRCQTGPLNLDGLLPENALLYVNTTTTHWQRVISHYPPAVEIEEAGFEPLAALLRKSLGERPKAKEITALQEEIKKVDRNFWVHKVDERISAAALALKNSFSRDQKWKKDLLQQLGVEREQFVRELGQITIQSRFQLVKILDSIVALAAPAQLLQCKTDTALVVYVGYHTWQYENSFQNMFPSSVSLWHHSQQPEENPWCEVFLPSHAFETKLSEDKSQGLLLSLSLASVRFMLRVLSQDQAQEGVIWDQKVVIMEVIAKWPVSMHCTSSDHITFSVTPSSLTITAPKDHPFSPLLVGGFTSTVIMPEVTNKGVNLIFTVKRNTAVDHKLFSSLVYYLGPPSSVEVGWMPSARTGKLTMQIEDTWLLRLFPRGSTVTLRPPFSIRPEERFGHDVFYAFVSES